MTPKGEQIALRRKHFPEILATDSTSTFLFSRNSLSLSLSLSLSTIKQNIFHAFFSAPKLIYLTWGFMQAL